MDRCDCGTVGGVELVVVAVCYEMTQYGRSPLLLAKSRIQYGPPKTATGSQRCCVLSPVVVTYHAGDGDGDGGRCITLSAEEGAVAYFELRVHVKPFLIPQQLLFFFRNNINLALFIGLPPLPFLAIRQTVRCAFDVRFRSTLL